CAQNGRRHAALVEWNTFSAAIHPGTSPLPREQGDLAMSASIHSLSASQQRRRKWESRFAGPMFFLGILFLIVLAGFLHRFPRLDWPDPEMQLILGGLGGLWLVFILEACVRFLLRDRALPFRKAFIAAAVFGFLPPLRLACRSQVRPNEIR